MRLCYRVDGEPVCVTLADDENLFCGDDHVLARDHADPLQSRPWYGDGFTCAPLLTRARLADLRAALTSIIADELGMVAHGLDLARYHHQVDDDAHQRVITRTRRLHPHDLALDLTETLGKLSQIAGCDLGFDHPLLPTEQWMICRINRPGSGDFNPVHKDIYEAVDHAGAVPRMVNFWIPLVGVSGRTGLPVAPGTHLLPESAIKRTRAGAMIDGRRYSVNSVASWDGQSDLTTITPREGEVLAFSSHLIHGLGRNLHADITRMSFEFRLFARNG